MKKKISVLTITISVLFTLFLIKANIVEAYNYENPLKVGSLTAWIEGVLAGIQGIVGVLAVAMIIIAGILYMFSGTSSNMLTIAKNMAMWAMIGFTIAVGAPALLKEIVTIANNTTTSANLISNAPNIPTILTQVLNFLLTIIGVLALISFIVSGFQYLTASGDRNKSENAKKIAFYSILAILVSGSGVIIIREIIKILSNN